LAPQPAAEATPEKLRNLPPRLVLGLMPIYGPDELLAAYAPLARYLGEQLGVPVQLVASTDYPSMVDDVLNARVDLVELAPLAYVMAKAHMPGLDLLVTNISEGSSTYSGYIVARADAEFRTVQDFRGRRFGFVDLDSSSGYLYPYAFFVEQGLRPERDFKQIIMTKRHDLAIEALLKGEIDATGTFSAALLNASAQGLDVNQLRIVARTGRIPYDAWCAQERLDPSVRRRLKQALLQLSTRTVAGRKILEPLKPLNGFGPATDAMYEEIRKMKASVDLARRGS
jgi:phosphate/phosphite/phosphonate ABC transporter binding protein